MAEMISPITFPFFISCTPPIVEQLADRKQVIDMPMPDRRAGKTVVAFKTGAQSSRTTCAPYVQVIPGLEILLPEPARCENARFAQMNIEQIEPWHSPRFIRG